MIAPNSVVFSTEPHRSVVVGVREQRRPERAQRLAVDELGEQPAEDPEQQRVDVEQARHQHQREEAGHHQVLDRVHAQHLQRVELLADLARAEVGGDRRARDTRRARSRSRRGRSRGSRASTKNPPRRSSAPKIVEEVRRLQTRRGVVRAQTVETSSGNQHSRSANRNCETNSPPYGYGGRSADQIVLPVRIIMSPISSSRFLVGRNARSAALRTTALPAPPRVDGRRHARTELYAMRWRRATPAHSRAAVRPSRGTHWYRGLAVRGSRMRQSPSSASVGAGAALAAGCGGRDTPGRARTERRPSRSRSSARQLPRSCRRWRARRTMVLRGAQHGRAPRCPNVAVTVDSFDYRQQLSPTWPPASARSGSSNRVPGRSPNTRSKVEAISAPGGGQTAYVEHVGARPARAGAHADVRLARDSGEARHATPSTTRIAAGLAGNAPGAQLGTAALRRWASSTVDDRPAARRPRHVNPETGKVVTGPYALERSRTRGPAAPRQPNGPLPRAR